MPFKAKSVDGAKPAEPKAKAQGEAKPKGRIIWACKNAADCTRVDCTFPHKWDLKYRLLVAAIISSDPEFKREHYLGDAEPHIKKPFCINGCLCRRNNSCPSKDKHTWSPEGKRLLFHRCSEVIKLHKIENGIKHPLQVKYQKIRALPEEDRTQEQRKFFDKCNTIRDFQRANRNARIETLVQKMEAKSEPLTKEEVIFLNHHGARYNAYAVRLKHLDFEQLVSLMPDSHKFTAAGLRWEDIENDDYDVEWEEVEVKISDKAESSD